MSFGVSLLSGYLNTATLIKSEHCNSEKQVKGKYRLVNAEKAEASKLINIIHTLRLNTNYNY